MRKSTSTFGPNLEAHWLWGLIGKCRRRSASCDHRRPTTRPTTARLRRRRRGAEALLRPTTASHRMASPGTALNPRAAAGRAQRRRARVASSADGTIFSAAASAALPPSGCASTRRGVAKAGRRVCPRASSGSLPAGRCLALSLSKYELVVRASCTQSQTRDRPSDHRVFSVHLLRLRLEHSAVTAGIILLIELLSS